jgi:hypothetical protein
VGLVAFTSKLPLTSFESYLFAIASYARFGQKGASAIADVRTDATLGVQIQASKSSLTPSSVRLLTELLTTEREVQFPDKAGTLAMTSDIPLLDSFDLGVSSTTVITVGAKGRKTIGYAGTIVSWRLVSDVACTCVIDIWKRAGAIPSNANSITASAKPSLTAAELNSSSTLTGWTTSVSATDVFILEVESNDLANYIYLELVIQKTP